MKNALPPPVVADSVGPFVLPPPTFADPIGSFVNTAFITKDNNCTPRTLRNWQKAGVFPQPDCVFNGFPIWRLATYLAWKQSVLAGAYAGPSRAGHLRPTPTPSRASAPPAEGSPPTRSRARRASRSAAPSA